VHGFTRPRRVSPRARRAGRREAVAFAAGWGTLALALLPPLDGLAETLFTAHMAQHVLLVGVAAPLLVLARPLPAALRALPGRTRLRVSAALRSRVVRAPWGLLSRPGVAFAVHASALWTWHLPGPHQAALGSPALHAAEHGCFLGSALLFWWVMIHGRGGRAAYGASAFFVFAAGLQGGALGALLALAPTVWYPAYDGAAAFGLSPLEDQQLAGLVMWIPAGLVYVGAGLSLLAVWLRESGARARRRDTGGWATSA
jgi:cytochrome c oxidase assembly factor CtaG